MLRCALALVRFIPGMVAIIAISGAEAANSPLDQQFTQTVRPFVNRYCVGCHSGATPAAQFDLKAYATVESVVQDHPRWALVMERLKAREMPPKPMPQPPAES